MVSMLASSAVDHELVPRSDHTKDYEIGICCFSTRPLSMRLTGVRVKTGSLGIRIMWSNMSARGLLCHFAGTINIQLRVLVYYKEDIITIISLNEGCSRHDIAENG